MGISKGDIVYVLPHKNRDIQSVHGNHLAKVLYREDMPFTGELWFQLVVDVDGLMSEYWCRDRELRPATEDEVLIWNGPVTE